MDRWSGILKVPLYPNSRAQYRVAASFCLSSLSRNPIVPSANAIFFNGDRVEGTGNPVIERLSDLQRIAEILVLKLGDSVNAWVIEASTFNGPFAVYKGFIPSVNKWGEPSSYDPTGFPASSSITSILSSCLKEAKDLISARVEESFGGEISTPSLIQPKTLLFGFSKGGTVLNQLVTELAFSEVKSTTNPIQENGQLMNDGHTYIMKEESIIPTSKERLLNSIAEIHYVDVGLNSTGAYLTDHDVIKRVAEHVKQRGSGIRFVLHGTPRQWSDSWRVWIRKEKDTMAHLLDSETQRCEGNDSATQKREGKLCVCERFYFADRPPNLQMHFEIIESMDLS